MDELLGFLRKIYSGLFRPEEARRYNYLLRVIRESKCRKIMEIGTWNGETALNMINCAKKHARSEEIEYYGFDIFESMTDEICRHEISKRPPSLARVEEKLEKSGARIHLYKGFTQEVMPRVVPTLPKMDLVFIDGGHSIATIRNDWQWTQQVMDKNTIAIFDDYWSGEWGKREDAGCQSLVDSLDAAQFDVQVLPVQDRFKHDWGVLCVNFVQVKRK